MELGPQHNPQGPDRVGEPLEFYIPVFGHGWASHFPAFRDTPTRVIRTRLADHVSDPSPGQITAWDHSIGRLQSEIDEVLRGEQSATLYSTLLECELPYESRRIDVILLVSGAVLVVEFKGKSRPEQADLDQVSAYARDLRAYHAACAEHPVYPILALTGARGHVGEYQGVHVVGPDALDGLVRLLDRPRQVPPIEAWAFLSHGSYRPLPRLVDAARELFLHGELPRIQRAHANTQPAVEQLADIIHEAAANKSRRLVLLTGVPGAGKTLVGLRIVHAHFLDDLAVAREDGNKHVPAVFLSGNGPLVQVLQYELRKAGADGKTFVRGVKDYVKTYSNPRRPTPPEHVLVFDEAQRAWDAQHVQHKHGKPHLKSEPEQFVEFAERIPDWCVVVGLIGGGQEIHLGEEGGLLQWRQAIEGSQRRGDWMVHGPPGTTEVFDGLSFRAHPSLNLDHEIRFHLARDLHRFVAALVQGAPTEDLAPLAASLAVDGYHLRITRELQVAKSYLWERYAEEPDKRFGLLYSSRDRDLGAFGIDPAGRFMPVGEWYGEPTATNTGVSCRHLRIPITEFEAQGLELDAVLLAWGSDLTWRDGAWSNEKAKRYQRRNFVRDALQLRKNAYRVLLTRGRDGSVVFVPSLAELDATYDRLVASGFLPLT